MRMKGVYRPRLVQMFQRAGSHLLQLLARRHAQISLPGSAPPVHFRVDPPPDLLRDQSLIVSELGQRSSQIAVLRIAFLELVDRALKVTGGLLIPALAL